MAEKPKKKPPIEAILGIGMPKGGAGEPDEDDTSAGDDAESMAVDAMMDAVKSGDRKAFGENLRAYLDVCVPKIVGEEKEPPADEGDGEEGGSY